MYVPVMVKVLAITIAIGLFQLSLLHLGARGLMVMPSTPALTKRKSNNGGPPDGPAFDMPPRKHPRRRSLGAANFFMLIFQEEVATMQTFRNVVAGGVGLLGTSYLLWVNVGGQFYLSVAIVLVSVFALWGLHKVLPHPDDMAD